MIIDHNSQEYKKYLKETRWGNQYNGARYYSEEIVSNIIPYIKTDRDWVTVNVPCPGASHLIVFIHNNLRVKPYEWLKDCNDIVLVCGLKETAKRFEKYGKTIYLPLSINVEEVSKYRVEKKTKELAAIGRITKFEELKLKGKPDIIGRLPREKFLEKVAQYKKVYAIGRCALEAKALGCEVLPYDPRFPDPEIWKVLDNRKAAKLLQKELNKIDGKRRGIKCIFVEPLQRFCSSLKGQKSNKQTK